MTDSFERITNHKVVYVVVEPETNALEATAALTALEVAAVAPTYEQQGLVVTPWVPQQGDLVEFCEDGGGWGEVVEVLRDGKAIKVQFDGQTRKQAETWDSFMFDPIKLAEAGNTQPHLED
jgi:hypothetical protein